MRSLVTRFLPALALLAGFATPAMAQEGRDETYPIVYGQRPITLQPNQFLVDLEFDYFEFGAEDPFIFAQVGLEYGVIKNLTVGTLPVILGLSPDTEVDRASAFGRYRFLYGATFPLELAAELQITFPFGEGENFGLAPGLRARYFINKASRLDVGLFLNVEFADPDAVLGLALPVELSISFTRQIFFGLQTGLIVDNFDASSLSVPLGLKVGYTIPRNEDSPFLDLYLSFQFPSFYFSPADPDGDGPGEAPDGDINTDAWMIGVGARFFAN